MVLRQRHCPASILGVLGKLHLVAVGVHDHNLPGTVRRGMDVGRNLHALSGQPVTDLLNGVHLKIQLGIAVIFLPILHMLHGSAHIVEQFQVLAVRQLHIGNPGLIRHSFHRFFPLL